MTTNPVLTQWTPVLVMVLAIMSGLIYNNHRISDLMRFMEIRLNDFRDLLRAEIKAEGAQTRSELRSDIARLEQRLERLEKERV